MSLLAARKVVFLDRDMDVWFKQRQIGLEGADYLLKWDDLRGSSQPHVATKYPR